MSADTRPVEITYGIDCRHDNCSGFASTTTLDCSQPADGTIRIDIAMAIEQTTLTCDSCGCEFYIGDVDVQAEHDECPEDDDEDDLDDEEDPDADDEPADNRWQKVRAR